MKLHEHNIPKKQEEQKFLKTADVIRNTETKQDDIPFDPERDILDTAWQGMKNELEKSRQNNNWGYFSSRAMEMKFLKPERFDELDIDDTAWQGMKNELEECRQNNQWGDFSMQAMEMKLLKPERFDELNIDDTAWQGMKDKLEEYRQNNNWGSFSSQAMEMKLLAAEKAEITSDSQIKIVPKRKPLETIEPLPQRPV